MSSSTTLIAVNLAVLEATLGSKDSETVRLVLEQAGLERKEPDHPITLVFLKEGGVLLNGNFVTPEDLKMELQRPERKGLRAYCIERRIGSPKAKYALSGHYAQVVMSLIADGTLSGWDWEVEETERDDEGLTLEEAVRELVDGRLMVTDNEETSQYAYALEHICRTIGEHLATIEGDPLLTGLHLDTPLANQRMPVKIPQSGDVPIIGYMTAEEVQQERSRLQQMDLTSAEPEVEHGRREYVQAIGRATELGWGIIAIGY